MRIALLALAVLLVLPSAAQAGRAEREEVREEDQRGTVTYVTGRVIYTATPGAGTTISVRYAGGAVEITDSGGVEAGTGCRVLAADRVTCADSTRAVVEAGDGDDTVQSDGTVTLGVAGGEGADRLSGGQALDGGPGDDVLRTPAAGGELVGGPGADELIGGPGDDTVSYREATGPVHADLLGSADDGAAGEGDRIDATVEHLVGGPYADELIGDARDNRVLDGGLSPDRIALGAGHDLLFSAGPDRVDLGPGDDRAFTTGGPAPDPGMLVEGGPGADHLSGSSGAERLRGGPGRDVIEGNGGDDDIDVLGGGGADWVSCSERGGGPPGVVRADVADDVFDCRRIVRPGPARADLVDFDAYRVDVACPPDMPRGCRGLVRISRGGQVVRVRRFRAKAGTEKIVISGRRALPPGRYRIALVTIDAAGAGVVVGRRFRVAARRP